MIAHRLTTIASADNLLYFKSRSNLVSAEKGSPEYDEIFEKLKCIQYAYGDDEKEENKDVDDDDDVVIEEEEVSEEEKSEKQYSSRNESIQEEGQGMKLPSPNNGDGRRNRINPSTGLDSTDFPYQEGRERLLSDNAGRKDS